MSTNIVPTLAPAPIVHYWRLAYADGGLFDEPESHRSIADTPPEARELYVMKRGAARALWRIPIPANARPVWYRVRSVDVTILGQPVSGIRLEATVLGYVFENGNRLDGKLYMLQGDGLVNVPERYIDQAAIERCWKRE